MRINSTLTGMAATILVGSVFSLAASAQTVGIAAGGPGSFSFGVASSIAKVASVHSPNQVRVQPSGGSNIYMPQVNAGFLDFGIATDFETWLAYTGKVVYTKPNTNLRQVAVMVPIMPGMFVQKDSKIKKFSEIKGMRLSSGFASQKIIGEVITAHLANAGLTYSDVNGIPAPNALRAAEDFTQGKTDALLFGLGSGAVLKASSKVGGLRFLSIDPSPEAWSRLLKVIPMAYQRTVKPSKRFHGVVTETKAMAFDMAFNTHKGASEKVVYEVVKAIHGNKKEMAAVFGALNGFQQKRMAKKGPVPFHPGAVKFYKEAGIWPK